MSTEKYLKKTVYVCSLFYGEAKMEKKIIKQSQWRAMKRLKTIKNL